MDKLEFRSLRRKYTTKNVGYWLEVRVKGQKIFRTFCFKSAKELMNHECFRKECVDNLSYLPEKISNKEWETFINRMLTKVIDC